jgi:hypothetical protein
MTMTEATLRPAVAGPLEPTVMHLRVVPCDLKTANEFVRKLHRHSRPVVGHKFSVGVACEAGILRGVAIIGRLVAQRLDDGKAAEVTRLCTDGTFNACSMLYGAARRAARALGYAPIYTYTLPDEGGASLRAAGFRLERENAGGSAVSPAPVEALVRAHCNEREDDMSTFSGDYGPEEEDGAGWGGLVPTKEEREETKRLDRDRQAKIYATTLAIAMHAKYYPEVTQWKPLPDTLGLLTQIDNMVSGLVRSNVQAVRAAEGGSPPAQSSTHTCPDCWQACSCNGDIDDLLDCCKDDADACMHCLGREDEDDAWGCRYAPGVCCMPGEHMMSECHTAEDAEACYAVTPND